MIDLISDLYCGNEIVVKCRRGISSSFPVSSRVRERCVLALSLFNICVDWVLAKLLITVIAEHLSVIPGLLTLFFQIMLSHNRCKSSPWLSEYCTKR